MGLAHNTQRLTCRVVLRGCCWLRNTRDSQLGRGAAARLLCSRVCESGSVATALPLSTKWSVLYSSEFLLCRARAVELFSVLWCQATVCAWHCGPARVLPAARAAAATPRRVTSKVQSGVSRVRRKPKSRGYWPKIDFFFVDLREFDFRLVFLATHLSAAPGSSSSSSSSSCSLKTTTVGARTSLWA